MVITVTNNTSANNDENGIFLHGSQNVVIENNTVYNCGRGVAFQEYTGAVNGVIRNITFMKNNIFVAKTIHQHCLSARSATYDINLYGNFSNNYYARPIDDTNTIATLVGTWTPTYLTSIAMAELFFT
jgi:parallel beta-helix repeat protein